MTHDPHDPHDPHDGPRLTAYALGELPEGERAAIEARLAADPAARAFVEETRAFAAAFGAELGAAPEAVLTDAQRAVISDRSRTAAPRGRVLRVSNWSVPAGLAAAALVALTFSFRHEIGAWWSPERDVARARAESRPSGGPAGPAFRDEAGDGDVRARRENLYDTPLGFTRETGAPAADPKPAPAPLPGAASAPAEPPSPDPARASRVAGKGDDSREPRTRPADGAYGPVPTPAIHGIGAGGGAPPPAGPGGGGVRASGGEGGYIEKLERNQAGAPAAEWERSAAGGSPGHLRKAYLPGSEGSPESYDAVEDNPFRNVLDSALSTFSIDVDTASYSNVRRFLRNGQLPPPGAVRIEEMLNSFRYEVAPPTRADPLTVHVDVAGCPWKTDHRLVRVTMKGREIDLSSRPASNLVFLIDVSGSMSPANKLPLLVESMKLLVEKLDQRDKVSVVVYAGAAGVVLPPTPGDRHEEITAAFDRLRAGGSTAGGAGIELAYRTAQEQFVEGGVNRVILATDGDFNVGVSDQSSLVRLIEEKAKSKVFLTVLGFGEGNLQDAKMEALADKGNGNYAYVDSIKEGKKVLVEQAAGTLLTIAQDVKLQVEFNPVRVAGYRLIGYENRVLATEDFANDRKDAGDLGAGHTVTALYEIVPTTVTAATSGEPLRYQQGGAPTAAAHTGELLNVKLRFKQPGGETSVLREFAATDSDRGFDQAPPDFQFAAAVAAFGMVLRDSPHKAGANLDMALELAEGALGYDPGGDRAEFVDLVRRAKELLPPK